MPETAVETQQPSSIKSEDLVAFANALLSGDFSARLPAREGDDAAAEATILFNQTALFLEKMVAEITRLSNEVRDGIFGGQAEFVVSMRRGPWRSSIEALNEMLAALTCQVRDMAKASRRLAAGRTDHVVTVECKNETLGLKNSLNALIERARDAKAPAAAAT